MSQFSCTRCSAQGPSLEAAPYPNATGRRIHAEICQGCWTEWQDMEVKIINEYRLNMLEREHRTLLKNHMNEFLNLDGTSKSSGQAPSAVAAEWKPQD